MLKSLNSSCNKRRTKLVCMGGIAQLFCVFVKGNPLVGQGHIKVKVISKSSTGLVIRDVLRREIWGCVVARVIVLGKSLKTIHQETKNVKDFWWQQALEQRPVYGNNSNLVFNEVELKMWRVELSILCTAFLFNEIKLWSFMLMSQILFTKMWDMTEGCLYVSGLWTFILLFIFIFLLG